MCSPVWLLQVHDAWALPFQIWEAFTWRTLLTPWSLVAGKMFLPDRSSDFPAGIYYAKLKSCCYLTHICCGLLIYAPLCISDALVGHRTRTRLSGPIHSHWVVWKMQAIWICLRQVDGKIHFILCCGQKGSRSVYVKWACLHVPLCMCVCVWEFLLNTAWLCCLFVCKDISIIIPMRFLGLHRN